MQICSVFVLFVCLVLLTGHIVCYTALRTNKRTFFEGVKYMSPLDMSVFLFFILIAVKAFKDSLDFWKEQDEQAAAARHSAHITSKQAVNAPVRRTVTVTRTPVRAPYRVSRVDKHHTVSLPEHTNKKLPSSRGAGRQLETAA